MSDRIEKLLGVGDTLAADSYTLETFGVKQVVITSVNTINRVYHWEANCLIGKVLSGYFFDDAVLLKKIKS